LFTWSTLLSRFAYCDHFIRFRVSDQAISPKFAARAFRTGVVRAQVERSMVSSAGQNTVSQGSFKQVELPLPPLNEQHRIVAKLESLQARSRRVRQALDAVPPLLEKLRQSILTAAFRGDLTKVWRSKHTDVEPASELLKRIRVERRRKWEQAELAKMMAKGKTPGDDRWKGKYKEPEPVDATGLPELPAEWCWVTLDAVSSRITVRPARAPSSTSRAT
jgi:type I restriction enzyme S subunit